MFEVLEELEDVFQSIVKGWQPPQQVVLGTEKARKSSLLERLCLMPLFAQDRHICTRMAIRVVVKRAEEPEPPMVEIWGTTLGEAVENARLVAASVADADIKRMMNAIIQKEKDARGAGGGLCVGKEVRITISSAILPPMVLIDLLGVVQVPDEARVALKQLVGKYSSDNKDNSVYLWVAEATQGGWASAFRSVGLGSTDSPCAIKRARLGMNYVGMVRESEGRQSKPF